jgi:hypothetical protein
VTKAKITPEELIDLIGELGREVYYLLDDCETSGEVGGETHTITAHGLEQVSAVLDKIEALPFEEPGVVLGPGAMLQAALKQTFLSGSLAPADSPSSDDSMPDEIVAWPGRVGPMTGEWSANTHDDERAVAYVRKDSAVEPESPGDTLMRLGMDGKLWAEEFQRTAVLLGYRSMDEGWLIGWFCNAIMAGYDTAANAGLRAQEER